MNIIKYIVLLTVLIFFFPACSQKKMLSIQDRSVSVEVADNEEMRGRGLMFRRELGTNQGMLFVFDRNQPVSFWMKNTFLPLSVAFIDSNSVIVDIQDMEPLDEETLHRTFRPVKYALEMNQGWFKANQIKAGDRVEGIR